MTQHFEDTPRNGEDPEELTIPLCRSLRNRRPPNTLQREDEETLPLVTPRVQEGDEEIELIEQPEVVHPEPERAFQEELQPPEEPILEIPVEAEAEVVVFTNKADGIAKTVKIAIPAGRRVECPILDCNIVRCSYRNFEEHMALMHKEWKLIAMCKKCGWTQERLHPVVPTHTPKCPGVAAPREELPYTCTQCPKRFPTKSGLSQHERHVHKEMRNIKRIEAYHLTLTRKRANAGSKRHNKPWSAEQDQELIDLFMEVRGVHSHLALLTERIEDRTYEQIRSRLRSRPMARRIKHLT